MSKFEKIIYFLISAVLFIEGVIVIISGIFGNGTFPRGRAACITAGIIICLISYIFWITVHTIHRFTDYIFGKIEAKWGGTNANGNTTGGKSEAPTGNKNSNK